MNLEIDGSAVHAATGGVDPAGTAPTVVLVHGAGMDGTVWQLQTRFLAYHGFRAVAVDLPGHGRSAGEPLATVEALGAWLARFVGALEGGPVHAVGHSLGTYAVLEAAAAGRDRFRSLVLLGTAETMPVHPALLDAAEHDLPRAAALVAAWSHAPPAHVGPHPTPGLWMIGGARALVERSRPGVLAADLRACASYEGAVAAAKAVELPVTVVAGRGDRMTPARSARALAEHLTDGTLLELDGVGHSLPLEAPGAVRRVLLDAFTRAG